MVKPHYRNNMINDGDNMVGRTKPRRTVLISENVKCFNCYCSMVLEKKYKYFGIVHINISYYFFDGIRRLHYTYFRCF